MYGIGGELISEYIPTANQSSPSKEYGYRGGEILIATETVPSFTIRWMLYDLLGSARIITDLSGSLATIERHDYLPYGEEIAPTVGQRNQGWQGYGVNTQRKKFTGYERDDESGLDFAQARYYASVQGRFTSPDPLLSSGMVEDPQSWNRYIYVGNRPTILTDPDGLLWYGYTDAAGYTTYVWFDSEEEFQKNKGRYKDAVSWRKLTNTHYYIGVNGHLIVLYTSGGSRDLGKIQQINYKQGQYEDAHREASAQTGAIIADFVIISVTTAVPIGRAAKGGVKLTQIVLDLSKDQLKDFVGGKFAEAVCFTAGTPIWTEQGVKPIEEIAIGDVILSYDVEAERLEYKSVDRTVIRESSSLFDVSIQGEKTILRVTANHPFFARLSCPRLDTGGRWVRVDELQSGHEVLNPDGKWVSVVRVQEVKGTFTVYNFEVADNHNYFVGKSGILVHNGNCYDDAVKAFEQKKGGHVYVMQGGVLENGKLASTPYILNDGVYKQAYYEHAVLIKDGKVYDKLGGFNGVPYKEWAKAVGVGKDGYLGGTVNKLRRITIEAARSRVVK